MEFAGFIVFLLIGVFAAGYSFRGFIGREIKKTGEELKAELVKAAALAKEEIKQVEAKATTLEKHI
jgi:hypothetical protein